MDLLFLFLMNEYICVGFLGSTRGKEPSCWCRGQKRHGFDPWVGKIPWRRAWQPTLLFLPGESHGERSLVGYGPWGRKESDTTEVTEHAYTLIYIQPSSYQLQSHCLLHLFGSPQAKTLLAFPLFPFPSFEEKETEVGEMKVLTEVTWLYPTHLWRCSCHHHTDSLH